MHEFAVKIKYPNFSEPKPDFFSCKKQSKFDLLYSQALSEVKKKFTHHSQNLPILKLKSYDKTLANYQSQKSSPKHIQSQHQQKASSNPLIRHKSINTICVRYSASTQKTSVNKILWEKKMSLQTLRIATTKKPSKGTLSKQFHKQSLRHLRQKTAHQSKEILYPSEDNVYSHMSITPLHISNAKEQRQKYLNDKKKLKQKFKPTFYNEKDRNGNKKVINEQINDGTFKHSLWQADRDEDEFINFVKHKVDEPDHD